MKKIEFWKPIIVSVLITPVNLLLALFSAGMGHGDYVLARILFPYTMLSTVYLDSITDPFIALAVLQFPIYGLILAISGKKLIAAGILLFIVHLISTLVCFALTANGAFS